MNPPNTASVSETIITLGSKNQKGDRHGLRFHKLAHAGVSIHEPCDLEGQRCARRLDLLPFPVRASGNTTQNELGAVNYRALAAPLNSTGMPKRTTAKGASRKYGTSGRSGDASTSVADRESGSRDSGESPAPFTFATERSHQRDAETMHDGLRDATSDTVGTGSLGRILFAIVSTMGVALVGYGTFVVLFGW